MLLSSFLFCVFLSIYLMLPVYHTIFFSACHDFIRNYNEIGNDTELIRSIASRLTLLPKPVCNPAFLANLFSSRSFSIILRNSLENVIYNTFMIEYHKCKYAYICRKTAIGNYTMLFFSVFYILLFAKRFLIRFFPAKCPVLLPW